MNNPDDLRTVLTEGGYSIVNNKILKQFGPSATLILSRLVDLDIMFRKKFGQLKEEYKDWFYQTSEQIEDYLGIAKDAQRRAISILEDNKLIKTERNNQRMPKWFKIEYFNISKYHLTTEKPQSRLRKSRSRDDGKAVAKAITNKAITNKEVSSFGSETKGPASSGTNSSIDKLVKQLRADF